MKITHLRRLALSSTALIAVAGLMAAPASAISERPQPLTGTPTVNTVAATTVDASASASASTSTKHAALSASDKTRLTLIINRGNSEINRRLSSLSSLGSKINAINTTALSGKFAGDKNTLTTEVQTEVTGLNSLKTNLDTATDLTTAKTDAQSIFSGYRVYALILPKAYLVKAADDQQVAENRLSTLATKIQSDITVDKQDGKDVTALQTKLADMTAKTQTAQGISSSMETKVINLQPSDYNSDHTILNGDRNQLKTAQTDITGAISDARSLIGLLRTL